MGISHGMAVSIGPGGYMNMAIPVPYTTEGTPSPWAPQQAQQGFGPLFDEPEDMEVQNAFDYLSRSQETHQQRIGGGTPKHHVRCVSRSNGAVPPTARMLLDGDGNQSSTPSRDTTATTTPVVPSRPPSSLMSRPPSLDRERDRDRDRDRDWDRDRDRGSSSHSGRQSSSRPASTVSSGSAGESPTPTPHSRILSDSPQVDRGDRGDRGRRSVDNSLMAGVGVGGGNGVGGGTGKERATRRPSYPETRSSTTQAQANIASTGQGGYGSDRMSNCDSRERASTSDSRGDSRDRGSDSRGDSKDRGSTRIDSGYTISQQVSKPKKKILDAARSISNASTSASNNMNVNTNTNIHINTNTNTNTNTTTSTSGLSIPQTEIHDIHMNILTLRDPGETTIPQLPLKKVCIPYTLYPIPYTLYPKP